MYMFNMYIHVFTVVAMYMYMYILECPFCSTCTTVCVRVYVCTCVRVYVCVCVCAYVCVRVYTCLQDSQPPTNLVVDPLPLPTANVINMMVSAARPCIMVNTSNNYCKCK